MATNPGMIAAAGGMFAVTNSEIEAAGAKDPSTTAREAIEALAKTTVAIEGMRSGVETAITTVEASAGSAATKEITGNVVRGATMTARATAAAGTKN